MPGRQYAVPKIDEAISFDYGTSSGFTGGESRNGGSFSAGSAGALTNGLTEVVGMGDERTGLVIFADGGAAGTMRGAGEPAAFSLEIMAEAPGMGAGGGTGVDDNETGGEIDSSITRPFAGSGVARAIRLSSLCCAVRAAARTSASSSNWAAFSR